ncbi:uncharacterized protein LOC118278158 isoform X3 [Spodoptera frugiperda]|uniref:Uncharacterized protein LOC118278158 isoform X3 n=1 Tax=Spodoptera frugiperda TaxID=7108 RepID=A0A9R0DH98_SPOFR|nr:uncharacterized protein LOC118278158 isoform X3 [Spodoptera frugiperda]
MIVRHIFTSLVIVGLAAEVWSHVEIEAEDYFFPLEPLVNYCKMSEQCSHDFVPICGQDAVGVARMFNDNCDMFELNCDEKQKYRHVKMDLCRFDKPEPPYE